MSIWNDAPGRAVMAAFAFNGAFLGTWGSRVPAVIENHSLSESSFSSLLLLLGLGALIAFQIVGRVSDVIGAAKLTRIWAVILAVATVLMGASSNAFALGAAIFCFGFAYGAMDIAMNSWATEVERHIGRSVMVSFHAMWSVGAGVGALGGYVFIALGQPVLIHFLLASLAFVGVVSRVILTPWNPRSRAKRRRNTVFVLPKGPLILVSIIAVATTLGEGAMSNWSAVYLHDVVGMAQSYAALGFAAYSAAMVATRLVADKFVLRYGPAPIARISGICAVIGLVFVVGVPTIIFSIVGIVLMGVGYASIVPLAFSRAAAETDTSPGEAIASVATLGHGAYLLGAPLIGVIAEVFSLRAAFGLLGVLALAIVILAPVLKTNISMAEA